MKEHGIIFQGWGVRAILNDLKSHTRRTYGLERVNQEPDLWFWGGINRFGQHIFYPTDAGEEKYPKEYPEDFSGLVKCPYGQKGDRLWVRETFSPGEAIFYKGSGEPVVIHYKASPLFPGGWKGVSIKWKPSIHMPRKYSRIDLEILNIKAERIQDISWQDVEKEGVDFTGKLPHPISWQPKTRDEAESMLNMVARHEFQKLWDSLNGKKGYGWKVNPWVWVIEFKRINPSQNQKSEKIKANG